MSSQGSKNSGGSQTILQPKITEFFPDTSGRPPGPVRKIFLTDVKTRGSKRPPREPAVIRPAKIQLSLYHRFLSEMAADRLDFLQVMERYGLDPDAEFSDVFIAQIGGLHDEIFYDAVSVTDKAPANMAAPQQVVHDLIRYKTLRSLLPLLSEELRLTFPHGADSLGSLVTVGVPILALRQRRRRLGCRQGSRSEYNTDN